LKTESTVRAGSGLVGSAIRHVISTEPEGSTFGQRPDEEWIFLSSKECDLRDFNATTKLFEKYRPTHVIHLAALVGGLFANMSRKLTFLRDNLLINDSVLQNSHDFKVQKLISCLSTCVFPDKVEYPLRESSIHLGPPHQSNFGYAHGKRLVDIQNHAYHEQYGDMFTSVIPTNVFGPGDNYDLEQAHVIPSLIHRCYKAEKENKPFVIAGTGKPLRQFIYSRDLAKLIIWTLRYYEEIDPIILSVPETDEISIKGVGDAIVKHVGYKGEYTYDTTKSDGQYRKPASNDKLMNCMRASGLDFSFTPFDDALSASVKWFVDNYENGARIGLPDS
ncbi:NAD dependent epimerase/dehydratase family-domain-containing protein, partial [Kockovaella imperatae]